MSPCDKITHVGYITDNTGWHNVLSIIEKHRFCKMIPVESNISLKSISWIIFLLRSYLSPFCSAFVRTGLVLSTGYHSSLANGRALKQIWGVPVVDQCSGECPSQPCSSPGFTCSHWSPVLVLKNQQELWESSGDIQAGQKREEKSHL